jgi:hypothetical protein
MKLVQREGSVYGARYYTTEPTWTDGTAKIGWTEMRIWCTETFGETTGSIWADEVWVDGEKKTPHPGERWYMNNAKFWFREQEDMIMFILRWS